jgi:hypothetical protein
VSIFINSGKYINSNGVFPVIFFWVGKIYHFAKKNVLEKQYSVTNSLPFWEKKKSPKIRIFVLKTTKNHHYCL